MQLYIQVNIHEGHIIQRFTISYILRLFSMFWTTRKSLLSTAAPEEFKSGFLTSEKLHLR